jgi:hypothetical protein
MKLLRNPFTFFVGGLLAAYIGWARPRIARWGTPEGEVTGSQPGDTLIPQPLLQMTHSISIQASPERVWEWIVQIGYKRGGFYSYDWLERMAGLKGLQSATRIDPALQKLMVGDTVKISPVTPMTVAVLQKNRAMVLRILMSPFTGLPLDRMRPSEPWIDWTWGFLLSPLTEQSCRLTSRVRAAYGPYLSLWPLMAIGVEPATFLMDRKMLETVRSLAEGKG